MLMLGWEGEGLATLFGMLISVLLEGGYHHGAPYTTMIMSNNEIDRWIDVIIAEMTKDKAVEVINQYAP